jgi:hypothetical protein
MDHDHKPDVNLLNKFTLWNATLINHFQGNNLLYSLRELEDTLSAKYKQSVHPAAYSINQLLQSTSSFLCQTNLEKNFYQSAIECKTDVDWQKIFTDIANAVKIAQAQCNEELKGTHGYAALEAAIQYCKNCIALKIHAIEKSQNKIQPFYIKYGDEIRKVMAGPAAPSYKK